jgi:16S rRNA (guanine527-N7)-methyltransferase
VKRKPPPKLEGLGRHQIDLLETYERLLADRGVGLGVIAEGDRERLWDRHIMDSLRGAPCISAGATVADLGAGAGLPGIPIAIARPDLTIHLIEARSRRVAFLELAVERLSLSNARVVGVRIEDAAIRVDGCLARALADPERAWRLASGVLSSEGGFLLYWAGRSWDVTAHRGLAAMRLSIQVCSQPSQVWPGSVVKMARTVLDPEPGTR